MHISYTYCVNTCKVTVAVCCILADMCKSIGSTCPHSIMAVSDVGNVAAMFVQWHMSNMCISTLVGAWFETQCKQQYIWTDCAQIELLKGNERILKFYANI